MAFDHGQLNEILCVLKAGNTQALDGILITVGRRMFALALGIVKNREDAEDVLQESFLKIAKGIHAYREDTNGYAWVMRIVRNCAFDFLRKRKIRATEDIASFFHLSDEGYSEEKQARSLVLEEAISRLQQEEKRVIYYRYYLEFTVREIARETGMSKSGVQRAIESAEKKLKEFLGQNDG